jgi:hypothetical protein
VTALLIVAAIGLITAPAPADVADLTRELDGVRTALDKAAADANAGNLRALQSSLKAAQESWSRFYVGYRGWGAGKDAAWVSDIDAVQAEFMNATNAVTPGNNAVAAAAALKRIQERLAGLRERNAVPDVDKATEELQASLAGVQESMKSLEGKAFNANTLAELSKQWTEISESWTAFNEVLIEANALGLSDGDLAKLKQRVERQGVLFEAVGSALGNANLSSGLTNLNSAMEGLRDLAEQWAAQSEEEDGGEPKGLLDRRRNRRVNFR